MSHISERKTQTVRLGLQNMLSLSKTLLVASLALASACSSTPDATTASAIVVGTGPTTTVTAGSFTQRSISLSETLLNDPDSWSQSLASSFNMARQLVENDLDVDLADVDVRLVDEKPINAEVALETRRLVREQFGSSVFAEHFLNQVMGPLSGSYAALYSSRLGAVLISRSMLESYERSLPLQTSRSAKRSALLALLIHELVHAADDKQYRIHDNRALNFRASFAQSATFEGHAQWVTRRICQQAGCSSGMDALDNFMFSSHGSSAHSTQAANRNVLEYSYVEGERFVSELAARENGAALLDSLLTSPPSDPVQILAPETYPDVAREDRNQALVSASRTVEHPWTTSPWIGVETSPLKGIDLRADPTRRQAAVDGFTKLIQGMVSMQFYDQARPESSPVEATILQAESAATANMFASMLHANTQMAGARVTNDPLTFAQVSNTSDTLENARIYRTSIEAELAYQTAYQSPFQTVIVVAGNHVVQVIGSTNEREELDDYAIRVLSNLSQTIAIAGNS